MKKLTILGLVFLSSTSSAAEHHISAFLEPSDQVFLNQQLRLIVEVETDTWFSTAPVYPEIKIPGAIVLQPEAFGVNSSRREGATTWTGQRQRYVIFPQRTGILAIPRFEVSFAATTDGQPGESTRLATPLLSVPVLLPPGAEGVDAFVATPSFSIEASWDRALTGLKVGDALVRTVTQSADATFALLLPAVEFPPVEGVKAYPAPPRLDDTANRGRYTARRVDAITYVLQQAGTRELPELVVHWFDLGANVMRREALAAVELSIAENPVVAEGLQSPEAPRYTLESITAGLLAWLQQNLIWLTALATLAYLSIGLWRRFRSPLAGWWRHLQYQRRHGERAHFRRVIGALQQGDIDEFVRCFWVWSDRLPGRSAPLSTEGLFRESESTDPKRVWDAFLQSRYRGASDCGHPPAEIAGGLRRLRGNWLQRRHLRPDSSSLNPSGPDPIS